jgi:predicted nucleic acid-binding protein
MTERSAVFFDTSALVKRYVQEQGSQYVARFFAAGPLGATVFVSTLTYVEVIAAFSRRLPVIDTALVEVFSADYRRGMQKILLREAVVERAAQLARRHRLRAADAIQLASALRVAAQAPQILLLTADGEMIAAAQMEGLRVDNPNRYP